MSGTPWPWIGMPRLYTLPVVMDAAAALTTSGVSRLSAPRSSSSPHRPQLLVRVVVVSVMSFPPETRVRPHRTGAGAALLGFGGSGQGREHLVAQEVELGPAHLDGHAAAERMHREHGRVARGLGLLDGLGRRQDPVDALGPQLLGVRRVGVHRGLDVRRL